MQVLVVEDDIRLAEALKAILKRAKYLVDVVHTGTDGLAYAQSDIYDVIVLDVMLPGMNGFEIVTELRRMGVSTPILMLTARASLQDKVGGLDSGADDYMTKPFAPAELLARLRSLTRRQGEVVIGELRVGNTKLDLESCELSTDAKSIHLGFKEFSILKILMSNPSLVTSKETLINKVWGIESSADDNNVEAYISFLRKKLKFTHSNLNIVTLRKVGYRLDIVEDE